MARVVLLVYWWSLVCCVFKICSASLANFEKGFFCLDIIEIAQCRLMGFTQIVTFVTSFGFTFLAALRFLDFIVLLGFTVDFAIFVRMRWGISPLRRRPRALPFGFPQAFEKA